MSKFEKSPGFKYYYQANVIPFYFAILYRHGIESEDRVLENNIREIKIKPQIS